MRAWTGLAAAILFLGVAGEARADCGPNRPWVQPATDTVLPADPTLYVFGAGPDDPVEVSCLDRGISVDVQRETLEASAAGPIVEQTALRIDVQTHGCLRFELRAGDPERLPISETFEVDPYLEPGPQDPSLAVVAADRSLVHFGCGPADTLMLEASSYAPAFEIELRTDDPGESARFVVPAYAGEDGTRFRFGRTMCQRTNIPLGSLDRPMQVRISALQTDGTSRRGQWQRIEPPAGYDGPRSEVIAFVVEAPTPPELDPSESTVAPASPEKPSALPWSWIILGLVGGLAGLGAGIGLWSSTRASRSDPP